MLLRLKKITETLDVTEPANPTKVDAEFFVKNTEAQLKATHTFVEAEGEFLLDGNFKNLILSGTEKQISIKTSDNTLEQGKRYKIKGFASGYSGGRFLNVFITSYEAVAANPVTSVEITNGETAEIFVSTKIKLETKVLPETAEQTVTFEVTEGKDIASVTEDGVVKGLKAGTAKVTVKSTANKEKSDVITITVKDIPELSGDVVEKVYNFTFAEALKASGGSYDAKGLTWTYGATEYMGKGDDRGIQIGSSKKPVVEPWTIEAELPYEATLKSYSVSLAVAKDTSNKYEFKYADAVDSGTVEAIVATPFEKEGINKKTSKFSITLSEAKKASYLHTVKLVLDVPVELQSLFDFK